MTLGLRGWSLKFVKTMFLNPKFKNLKGNGYKVTVRCSLKVTQIFKWLIRNILSCEALEKKKKSGNQHDRPATHVASPYESLGWKTWISAKCQVVQHEDLSRVFAQRSTLITSNHQSTSKTHGLPSNQGQQ